MIERRFIPYYGKDAARLPTNENHLQFKWVDPVGNFCFSCTRKGDAMSCHYTADKKAAKVIHKAIDEGIEFIFRMFPWCKMVMANVKHPSAKKTVRECGFEYLTTLKDTQVFIMRREAYI